MEKKKENGLHSGKIAPPSMKENIKMEKKKENGFGGMKMAIKYMKENLKICSEKLVPMENTFRIKYFLFLIIKN